MGIPFIDWNGNGHIDSMDIAMSLAMQEEENNSKLKDDAEQSEEQK